jgi:ribosomal protein S18 acetylase RimI-like enzyme
VRAAVARDLDQIARLWAGLVHYHRQLDAGLPEAAEDGPQRYARRLAERLTDPATCVLVAAQGKQVVGYVLGFVVDLAPDMFVQASSGFIADIYVDEEFRGRGVGRSLVSELADWFRERGVRYFEWHVAAHNQEGIAFWRAIGGRDVMLRMRADLHDDKGDTP